MREDPTCPHATKDHRPAFALKKKLANLPETEAALGGMPSNPSGYGDPKTKSRARTCEAPDVPKEGEAK